MRPIKHNKVDDQENKKFGNKHESNKNNVSNNLNSILRRGSSLNSGFNNLINSKNCIFTSTVTLMHTVIPFVARLIFFALKEQTNHRCTSFDSKRLWDHQGCHVCTNHISSRICQQFTPNNVLNIYQVVLSEAMSNKRRKTMSTDVCVVCYYSKGENSEKCNGRSCLLNFQFLHVAD